MILTDQHRDGLFSAAGDASLRTPHLDRLLAAGTRFPNACCASPLCAPARAALLTGRMPHETGVTTNGLGLPDGLPTFGDRLRAAGYLTEYAGEWDVPGDFPLDPDHVRGFTLLPFADRITDGHGYPLRIAGHPDHWKYNLGAYTDRFIADLAIAALRRPSDRPRCLVVAFANPHDICFPDIFDRAGELKESDLPPLPANFEAPTGEADLMADTRWTHEHSATVAQGWDERGWRRFRGVYRRFIEMVDVQIGRVLDALDDSGRADRTVVVYSSDHGEADASHRWTGKVSLYEHALSIPIVIRRPGGAAALDRSVASSLDLFPTLCSLAGAPVPAGLTGRDLLAAPAGDPAAASALYEVETGSGLQGRSIRTARYRYAAFSVGAIRETLFDLAADPGETVNVAAEPAHAAALTLHRGRLRAHLARTGDGFTPPA